MKHRRNVPDLSHLATPGRDLAVRVTPRAGHNSVTRDADGLVRVHVTCAPESGKANQAVTEILATALGVAKSRLVLLRGTKARDKLFRLE